MSEPTQISTNSAPSPLLRRRAKMMHSLPPVFSPEHSPPMGVTGRTSYLPLISPAPTEEGKQFDFSVPRRGSTPSLNKSSASQYFEELRKRRRTSETSMTAATSNATASSSSQTALKNGRGSQGNGRFAELPSSIAQSIYRALESQAKASNSAALKKRTMSMPNTRLDDDLESGREDKRQRRASIRSQQLALLASQARLARTGATSVGTALRAERAVEGAVRQVVKEAQAGVDNLAISSEPATPQNPESRNISPTEVGEKPAAVVEMQEATTSAWSDALDTPHKATAFLSSASAVAHDWANGFYRFEEEWAEDALKKEQRRLSEQPVVDKSEQGGAELLEVNMPSPKKAVSAPSTREASPAADATPEVDTTDASHSVRSSLVAAHKRLSASLPAVPMSSSNSANVNEGGGQLVDVLSNFASLIGQRKEVCHSLEKLAQDAKSLSTVPLPSISSSLILQPTIVEETDQDDYIYEGTPAQ